jgi:ATP-binding cassette subfamily F protein 3
MRYEQRLKAYQLQESEIQKLNMLIQKFKPKPNKVSFAKDREKKLERILNNKLERPTNQTKRLKVQLQARQDQRVRQMTVTQLEYGYEERPLSNPIDFSLFNGDKLAIIGDNGVGKTTLLKTLAGMIQKIGGEILHHRKLKIGYIDQNQIHIESNETIFNYFHDLYPMMSHYEIRSHLGAFLFSGDDVEKMI